MMIFREDQPLSVNVAGTLYRQGNREVDLLRSIHSADQWLNDAFKHLGKKRRWTITQKQLKHLVATRYLINVEFRRHCHAKNGDIETSNAMRKLMMLHRNLRSTNPIILEQGIEASYRCFIYNIIDSALWVLSSREMYHLRECQDDHCMRFFVSASKNKKWCSNLCGNRVRVRKHYNKRGRRPFST